MELKEYQIQVLETLEKYLQLLESEYKEKHEYFAFQQNKGNEGVHPEYSDYLQLSWQKAKAQFALAREYTTRKDGLKRNIPNICFKVPTGGGKTLLATCAIERIQKDYFKTATGFVLWIVPSETIYRQTSKQLRNREHPYRQMLDRASGGRTKILEKNDKFVKQDIDNHLCVMLLMLQSSNRENKETLRMFRDSGKFTSFFPEADDYMGNNELLNRIRNLDIAGLADGGVVTGLNIKHSLGNVMKLIRPIIIIDEGHKATSEKALETINNFHPRFILELSATPKPKSNILVNIKGMALKQEEMIKLPIHVSAHTEEDWKQTLNYAHKKLNQLHDDAGKLQQEQGRYIRPIMVIKAEPKRKDSTYDHVEEIKKYLIDNLNIPEMQIRIKLSEKDEIKDEDLLDKLCPVRYIITKEALKEGWDCPFAYILAILTNAKSETALTQFIGRVLRQPEAKATKIKPLNESYVFCMGADVNNAVDAIKQGLETEGMGDIANDIVANGSNIDNGDNTRQHTLIRNDKYRDAVFLPKLNINEAGKLRAFDYYQDILTDIIWQDYHCEAIINLQSDVSFYQTAEIDVTQTQQFSLDITARKTEFAEIPKQFDKALMVAQLMAKVPNPFQASRIIDEVLKRLENEGKSQEDITNHAVFIVEEIKRDCLKWVLAKSEIIFKEKLETGEIFLKLLAMPHEKLNWVMPETINVFTGINEAPVTLDKNIFTPQFQSLYNGYEYGVATYINKIEAIKWWHRLGVKGTEYHVQGWKHDRIYPDFLIRMQNEDGAMRFQFIETKGNHLKGNDDTEYKRQVFEYLNQLKENNISIVGEFTLQEKQHQLDFQMVFQENYENRLNEVLLIDGENHETNY